MRNPNGYGGISNIGGNRRNPFRVRITVGWEYDKKTGKQKQKYATLGYYPTRKDAMIALAEYNKDPYDLDKTKVTFEEIYMKWSASTYPKMGESSRGSYTAAFKNLAPLHKRKMRELKKNELQDAMDSLVDKSDSTQTNAKTLMSYLFKYCIENDLIDKDYSQFVTTNPNGKASDIHKPYSSDEIRLLWNNLDLGVPLRYSAKDIRDIHPVDLILIMIYTGMRPGELLQIEKENVHLDKRYMIGGLKTKAGRGRIIPIHEDIVPLVEARYSVAGKWLIPYKSDNPPTMNQYRNYLFDPIMEKLKLGNLPDDGRHTFATFADKANLKDHIIKLIVGHKINDVTKDVYTHITAEELVEAVNKIDFLKK